MCNMLRTGIFPDIGATVLNNQFISVTSGLHGVVYIISERQKIFEVHIDEIKKLFISNYQI